MPSVRNTRPPTGERCVRLRWVLVLWLASGLVGCPRPSESTTPDGSEDDRRRSAVARRTRHTALLRELEAQLGSSVRSHRLRGTLVRTALEPRVRTFEDSFYYSYKPFGISLFFKRPGILRAIFLYAAGADGFAPFAGALPRGLTFADTRRDVERKLGRPASSGGGGIIPYWVSYPRLGLAITFVSRSTTDPSNRIHHLTITAPKG